MGRLLACCVCLAGVAVAGCYSTPTPACQFLCGASGSCPDGYACDTDDRCHRVEANGQLAACPDELPVDAEAAPVDAAVCPAGFAPSDDGSGVDRQALVISEIKPGEYIELYNNLATSITLGSAAYVLQSPTSNSLALSASDLTIPSHGFRTVAWPGVFPDTAAGGEILLYTDDTDYTSGTTIMDFVCWGAKPHASRQALAESSGKWGDPGLCAAAITGGSITRLPATDGLNVADYDVAAAGSPTNCDP